jgi:hypothetical protein
LTAALTGSSQGTFCSPSPLSMRSKSAMVMPLCSAARNTLRCLAMMVMNVSYDVASLLKMASVMDRSATKKCAKDVTTCTAWRRFSSGSTSKLRRQKMSAGSSHNSKLSQNTSATGSSHA